MKFRIALFLIMMAVAMPSGWCRVWSVNDMVQPRQYDASNWVYDPESILSPQTKSSINALIEDINRQTNAEVAVAVIGDYDGSDIDSFSGELFNHWGLGERGANNGVLLVVAKDARKYAFRTGRGIGSVLTDVETARIARNSLVPNFRVEDYDGGVLAAVSDMHQIMTAPDAVEEIREGSARAKEEDDLTVMDVVISYLWFCIGLTLVLCLWFVYKARSTAKMERHARYNKLYPSLRILYGLSFVGLGMPFLVYYPAKQFMKNLREGEHKCPNCGTTMYRLDEVNDNTRLTPAQDAEERFNSVDYDVWECPNCGEEDIYGYENADSPLETCPHCGAKTAQYVCERVIKRPTSQTEGIAMKEYHCLNCNKTSGRSRVLPRTADGRVGPIIFPGGGRGFGGGGSFGGGFGGGVTGGGGSSGGW
ncbi:MAG: TPM domain-containing protein [Muribaculaceae bacterium]|nr:TPM domain-containing protein [Muribaculaceae bacterium]